VTDRSTQELIDETIARTTQLMGNAKIMMVDDEPLNMEVLQVHLETEGYSRFVSISDSLQAIEAIRAELPDVLLLDLVMPMVSGFDILRELQLALRMRNTLSSRAYQQRLLNFDQLTDLPNRSLFTRKLRKELDHTTKTGEQSTLLLFNINRFKTINDSLGPDRGDEVLWAFSERLKGCFKDVFVDDVSSANFDASRSNIVARVGGDRFAVLPWFMRKVDAIRIMHSIRSKWMKRLASY